jgi:hypothetical protein
VTFEELVSEVTNRGFDDLKDGGAQETRVKRWVNQAYHELLDDSAWPFLEATQEGTAPLTISELGHVLSFTDKTDEAPLRYIDRRTVLKMDPALSIVGIAEVWYREGESSLKVWPANTTATYVVRYLKTGADLSAASDTPLVPTRFQDLIVDGAVVRAYKNRDNFEAAQAVRKEWERGLAQMRHALLKVNYDANVMIQRTGRWGDYL